MSGILAVVDHLDGAVLDISNEVVGAAVALSQKGLEPVSVAVMGRDPEKLAAQLKLGGVGTVYQVKSESNHFNAIAYEQALLKIGGMARPSLILAPHTINGMTYAPALAVRLGCGFATDVFGVEFDDDGLCAKRGAYGNKVESILRFQGKAVTLLTVRGGAFPANEPGEAQQVVAIDLPKLDAANATRHVGYDAAAQSDVDIAKAEIILSVGRGIQDEKNIVAVPRTRDAYWRDPRVQPATD